MRPAEHGGTDYTWSSGPNEGYGFGSSGAPNRSMDEHRESIAPSLPRWTPARVSSRTTEAAGQRALPAPDGVNATTTRRRCRTEALKSPGPPIDTSPIRTSSPSRRASSCPAHPPFPVLARVGGVEVITLVRPASRSAATSCHPGGPHGVPVAREPDAGPRATPWRTRSAGSPRSRRSQSFTKASSEP